MAARLRSIESTLSGLQLSTVIAQAQSSASDSRDRNSSVAEDDMPAGSSPVSSGSGSSRKPSLVTGQSRAAQPAVSENSGETALQAINDAVDLINSLKGQASAASEANGETGTEGVSAGATVERIMALEGWTRPDAIERGVMSVDECTKSLEM